MDATSLVEDYLFAWILLSVALGVAVPRLSVVTEFSTPILAVMVGSVSLTLSVSRFLSVDPRALGRILLGHLAMPVVGFVVARGLGLSPALTAGFVLLGAVTPELVTPTMTALADGDTALASTALVVIGGVPSKRVTSGSAVRYRRDGDERVSRAVVFWMNSVSLDDFWRCRCRVPACASGVCSSALSG